MKMYAEAINIRFNTDAIKLSGEQVGLNSVLDKKPRAKLRQKNLHLSQLILLLTLNLPKVDLFLCTTWESRRKRWSKVKVEKLIGDPPFLMLLMSDLNLVPRVLEPFEPEGYEIGYEIGKSEVTLSFVGSILPFFTVTLLVNSNV